MSPRYPFFAKLLTLLIAISCDEDFLDEDFLAGGVVSQHGQREYLHYSPCRLVAKLSL